MKKQQQLNQNKQFPTMQSKFSVSQKLLHRKSKVIFQQLIKQLIQEIHKMSQCSVSPRSRFVSCTSHSYNNVKINSFKLKEESICLPDRCEAFQSNFMTGRKNETHSVSAVCRPLGLKEKYTQTRQRVIQCTWSLKKGAKGSHINTLTNDQI